ncbi:MAG: ABC transporter substrate-binding protein [Thermaerobacter sp.]|nr:ABC transporter substrate-binding protein [Thermaerobacter sp.]
MRQAAQRRLSGLATIGILGLVLGACSAPTHHAALHRRGTLRLSLIGAPATIDPLQVQDASGTQIDELVYDGLVRVSPGLLPQSDLAKTWHISRDGRTYTFQLNPRAKWQDGQPVTPQDVVFSFAAYRNPADKSPAASLLGDVQSVAAIGKDAVRVRLEKPDAPFLLQVATLPILPSHLLSRYTPGKALLSAVAPGDRTIGTGPFKITSATASRYTFTANKRYFLGAPHLRGLTLTVQQSPDSALMLLRRGKLDFAGVPLVDAAAVRTWPAVRLVRSFQLAFAGIVWNVSQPPFNSPAMRRALYFAVNRSQIVSGPLYGYGAVANGPIPPVSWADDKSLAPRAYLPQRALQLLAAAGWHETGNVLRDASGAPLRLDILAPSGAPLRTAALGLVARDLSAVGIEVTVHYEPFAQYTQDYISGNFQAAFAVRGLSADPDVSAYFGSPAVSNAGLNTGGYKDAQVDSDLQKEMSLVDRGQRLTALTGVQSAMQVDPPELFLYFPQSVDALSSRFAGFTPNPATTFYAPQNWSDRPLH